MTDSATTLRKSSNWDKAKALQRTLADDALTIVMRSGERRSGRGVALASLSQRPPAIEEKAVILAVRHFQV